MAPAEVEFDVTDAAQVSALAASIDGPVLARREDLRAGPDFDPATFVESLGSLRVRM